jgi:hypothetical protein
MLVMLLSKFQQRCTGGELRVGWNFLIVVLEIKVEISRVAIRSHGTETNQEDKKSSPLARLTSVIYRLGETIRESARTVTLEAVAYRSLPPPCRHGSWIATGLVAH